MNPYRLKVSQLRALVAVAEYGNFSEAALHLELSQSTVSHAIASLEEELGVVLLKRGRHGAYLTPIGERIVTHAQVVLQQLSSIVTEATRERGLQGGQVRIASYRSIATHILPTAIARFRRHFPDIAITITEEDGDTEIEQSLRRGQIDLGFMNLPASPDFETYEIMRDEYIVLLPPSESLTNVKLSWQQLATYPLIISRLGSCSQLIRHHLRHSDVPLQIAYEVRRDSTIVSMVVQGLGAAILPRLAAEPVPAGIKVCCLPLPLERVLGAVVPVDALQSPAVFAFLDVLKNQGRFQPKTAV